MLKEPLVHKTIFGNTDESGTAKHPIYILAAWVPNDFLEAIPNAMTWNHYNLSARKISSINESTFKLCVEKPKPKFHSY